VEQQRTAAEDGASVGAGGEVECSMPIGPELEATDYIDGDTFHREVRRVYDGTLGFPLNKSGARMAHVRYVAPHENRAESGVRRGGGNDWATWVFAEESGIAERIFTAPLELIIDARLEPGAAIGLHVHAETEEVYYILEGELTMTSVAADGREGTTTLRPGDAHAVTIGQGHFGVAGPEGARFIAVAVRAR
jgi:quercetin dioxygenase-like cupin family protein